MYEWMKHHEKRVRIKYVVFGSKVTNKHDSCHTFVRYSIGAYSLPSKEAMFDFLKPLKYNFDELKYPIIIGYFTVLIRSLLKILRYR